MPSPRDDQFDAPQPWRRDRDRPCVWLGEAGAFDDCHLLAPCVMQKDGRYWMYYCGARGLIDQRVYCVGLAVSDDGVHFTRHSTRPVLAMPDGRHSVLTPCLLRQGAGDVVRDAQGRLRMWFSAADFSLKDPPHTLRVTSSEDGLQWSQPTESLLDNVYAPTVLQRGGQYEMWYTDPSADPWCFRHATSSDGIAWRVTADPVMRLDQPWEQQRLFYPYVIEHDGKLLMWYGSYDARKPQMQTAIGFATSDDGLSWHKHTGNPVFEPEPANVWESHYTTSQTVMKLADGSWRIWYASRTKPPFTHKYFAIGTAHLSR